MDNKVRRLTGKQLNEFYQKYAEAKSKKFAGDVYDKDTWRNEVETYLNKHASSYGKGFTNEQVKKVNRLMIETNNYTGKQKSALRASYQKFLDAKEISRDLSEWEEENVQFWNSLLAENPKIASEGLTDNWGIIYKFMKNYSGDWNEYFNS